MLSNNSVLGLIAYWKFDDTNGTTAVDSSGNGNDGLLSGHRDLPVWTSSGCQFGGCLTFDGTDDYVIAGKNVIARENFTITNSFTYSLWVAPDRSSKNFGLIALDPRAPNSTGRGGGSNNANESSLMVLGGGDVYYEGFGSNFDSGFHLSSNDWNQLVVVMDKGVLTLYVNGTSIGTKDFRAYGQVGVTNHLYVGQLGDGQSFFGGELDEVQVYSRALNSSEVSCLYGNRLPNACATQTETQRSGQTNSSSSPPPSGISSLAHQNSTTVTILILLAAGIMVASALWQPDDSQRGDPGAGGRR